MSGLLDGRAVLVTGAGAGVGRGVALAAAAAGAQVVVATRNANGQDVAEEIVAAGGTGRWQRCDVTDAASVAQAVQATTEAFGGLDAIVHNATSNRSSQPHALADVDAELWAEHAAVTLHGAYHCAQAGFAALRERGGTLVLLTSAAGMAGSATLPLYATVKGAVRGLTKSLAREWAPAGVRVNAVFPIGWSPAMEKAIEADPAMEGRMARGIPLGRVGDPQADVGRGVSLLLSAEAGYITGQSLGIDGGHFTML